MHLFPRKLCPFCVFFSHLAKNFLKFCYRKFPNVHYLSIMKFLLVNHYIGFWSIARDIVWNLDKKFIMNRKKKHCKNLISQAISLSIEEIGRPLQTSKYFFVARSYISPNNRLLEIFKFALI